MKKIFILLLLSYSFSFAYFMIDDNYGKQLQVLKNLDIDTSFFHDSKLLDIRNEMSQNQAKYFLRTLKNGSEFVPMLKKMINDGGIPETFLYLAMVESEFSTKAYSKAKASGLWQFMAPTAKKFGLEIDEYIDERRDPIKSTKAAIEYLQTLHKMFGKWYLAAMAYNCGEGRVSRAIKEAKTDNLAVLLDEDKKFLPAETRKYIRKIIAMANLSEDINFILENEANYLLNRGTDTVLFEKVEVKGGSPLEAIASAINIPLEQLLNYNTHLNYFFTPPDKDKYHVYIPYDKRVDFANNFNEQDVKLYVYIVKWGDNFSKISKQYNVSASVIKDFNGLDSYKLKVGQKIFIPGLTQNTEAKLASTKEYIIKKGDTLYSISSKYNVNIQTIMHANNLKDGNIYPGGKLEIPTNF